MIADKPLKYSFILTLVWARRYLYHQSFLCSKKCSPAVLLLEIYYFSLLKFQSLPSQSRTKRKKALKAFMKPSEAPQRSVKTKIWINFYSNTTFWNARAGKGLYQISNSQKKKNVISRNFEIGHFIRLNFHPPKFFADHLSEILPR